MKIVKLSRAGLPLLILAVTTLSPVPANAALRGSISPAASATTSSERQTFANLARLALSKRNDAYIGVGASLTPRSPLAEVMASGALEKEVATEATLHQRGQQLKLARVKYLRQTTDVAVGTSTIDASGRTAHAHITETSRYYFARIVGDEPEYTAQSIEREARYVLEGAHWRLDSLDSIQTGGLAPINDVVRSVDRAPVVTGPLVIKHSPSVISAAGRGKAATASKSSLAVEPVTTLASWYNNYYAMADYAKRYWQYYNPDFKVYNDRGGDCTNFLSQALQAGGWPIQSGFYQYTSAWWYNQWPGNPTWLENASWPWVNAWYWYWFAINSGRTYILGNVWWMGIADVLQLDFNHDGALDHSMLVTATSSSGEKYLTYHSNNTLNRPLSDIIRQYPTTWYYAHRT